MIAKHEELEQRLGVRPTATWECTNRRCAEFGVEATLPGKLYECGDVSGRERDADCPACGAPRDLLYATGRVEM